MSPSYRKRPKHTSRSNSLQFPSVWSDWVYDEKQDRDMRYRLKGPDQFEYDYRQAQKNVAEQERPLDLDHSPVPQKYSYAYGGLNTYSTATEADLQLGSAQKSLEESYRTHITTRDPSTNKEEFDPHYKVQKPNQFRSGRIFKVLWSEPRGNGIGEGNSDDSLTIRLGKNGDSYEKVRRFVIVNSMAGHCVCLPITTYGGQGVNKKGVHTDHYTIIYSSEAPKYLPGEEQKLTKWPLLVEPASPRHKLDPASRLNYAKPYTIEYNIKVWFIGKVVDNSYWQLAADYNLVHPPLPVQPLRKAIPSISSISSVGSNNSSTTTGSQ